VEGDAAPALRGRAPGSREAGGTSSGPTMGLGRDAAGRGRVRRAKARRMGASLRRETGRADRPPVAGSTAPRTEIAAMARRKATRSGTRRSGAASGARLATSGAFRRVIPLVLRGGQLARFTSVKARERRRVGARKFDADSTHAAVIARLDRATQYTPSTAIQRQRLRALGPRMRGDDKGECRARCERPRLRAQIPRHPFHRVNLRLTAL
jgi:hypothetical protein